MGLRQGPDRGALRLVKAAFRAGQDRGGTAMGRELRGRTVSTVFVREEQVPCRVPLFQQGIQLDRSGNAGERRAGALLCRFDQDGAGAFQVELVRHAAAGQHGLDVAHAQFARLFQNQVEPVLFQQGGAEREIRHLLTRTQQGFASDDDIALAHLGHARGPFAGHVIAQDHGVAGRDAHHPRQVMRLRPVQRDNSILRQRSCDKQARRAFRRPGGSCGHGRSHSRGWPAWHPFPMRCLVYL